MFELNRTNHIMKYVASQDKPVAFSAIHSPKEPRAVILVHPTDAKKYIDFVESATEIYSDMQPSLHYVRASAENGVVIYPGIKPLLQDIKFNIPCRALKIGVLGVSTINPNTLKTVLYKDEVYTITSFFSEDGDSLDRKYGLDPHYTNNVFLRQGAIYNCLNTSKYWKPGDTVLVVDIDYQTQVAILQNTETTESFKIQASEIEYFFERIG